VLRGLGSSIVLAIALVACGDSGVRPSGSLPNQSPAPPPVSVAPAVPQTGDWLQATWLPVLDPDGDLVSYQLQWFVDGTHVPELDNRNVPPEITEKGQTWVAQLRVSDGGDWTLPTEASTTIVNAPPVVTAALEPAFPRPADPLRAVATATDPDGDPVTLEYTWFVQGVDAGIPGTEVPPERTSRGEIWAVEVTPSDESSTGEPVRIQAEILNTNPAIRSVQIEPADIYTATQVYAVADVDDPDGDPITATWTWSVDGAQVQQGPSPALDSSFFLKHQEVTVALEVHDGFWGTSRIAPPAVVLNTPPTAIGAHIEPPNPTAHQTLTCVVDGFADDDGDSLVSFVSWTRNGAPLVGAPEQLDGSWFVRDDEITCVASVSDGDDPGPALPSASVIAGNARPQVDLIVFEPLPAHSGEQVEAQVQASDPDGDPITLTYSWSIDGQPAGTGPIVDLTGRVRGQAVDLVVTPQDDRDFGDPFAAPTWTVANAPPTASKPVITPTTPTTVDEVSASSIGSDLDGDPVTITWRWSVDGTVVLEGPDTLPASEAVRGQTVRVEAAGHDGFEQGPWSDYSFVVANAPPTAEPPSITPESPMEGDTLTCEPGLITDPEGDSTIYTVQWTVNGSIVLGQSGTLDSTHWNKGDLVVCQVTPKDQLEAGTPVSSPPVEIVNAPPSIDLASILPDAPTTLTPLVGVASGASDPDGDPVLLSYRWLRGGLPIGTADTLPALIALKGESITLEVTPSDSEDSGSPVLSAPIVIGNAAPSVDSIVFSPASPGRDDTIDLIVTLSDPDGDPTSHTVEWTKGGSPLHSGPSLPPQSAYRFETVWAAVTPSDGEDFGLPVQASVELVNTPPSVGTPWIGGEVFRNGSIDCEVDLMSWYDPDGDIPDPQDPGGATGGLIAFFLEDGTPLDTEYLDGSLVYRGDRIYCTVQPFDPYDMGAVQTSAVAEVGNAPPTVDTLFLSGGPTRIAPTVATVGLSDPDGDSASYTETWFLNGIDVGGVVPLGMPGDSVELEVVATDAPPAPWLPASSEPSRSVPVIVQNLAPQVDSITLDQGSYLVEETATASWTGSDPESDSLTPLFYWELNGFAVGGNGPELDLQAVGAQAGDTLRVKLVLEDPWDPSPPQWSEVVPIENSPPRIDAIEFSPEDPRSDEYVSIGFIDFYDPDFDTLGTYTVTWYLDGSPVGTSEPLDHTLYTRGDLLHAVVTMTDSAGKSSSPFATTPFPIRNALPRFVSAELLPANPTSAQSAFMNATLVDPDTQDFPWAAVEWIRQGDPTPASTASTLSSSLTQKGEVWDVWVTPQDGIESGDRTLAATFTIANSPPNAPSPVVSPASPQAYTDDLLCTVDTTGLDPDGDPLTVEISWSVIGGPRNPVNTPAPETTVDPSDTIPAVQVDPNTTWRCLARVVDTDGAASPYTNDQILSSDPGFATCQELAAQQLDVTTGSWFLNPTGVSLEELYCDLDLVPGFALTKVAHRNGQLAFSTGSTAQGDLGTATYKLSDITADALREQSDAWFIRGGGSGNTVTFPTDWPLPGSGLSPRWANLSTMSVQEGVLNCGGDWATSQVSLADGALPGTFCFGSPTGTFIDFLGSSVAPPTLPTVGVYLLGEKAFIDPPSCAAALRDDPLLASGQHTIDPDGAARGLAAFSAECDMTTDGGGWSLAAKLASGGSEWAYTAPEWTQPGHEYGTLNLSAGDARYLPYEHLPVDEALVEDGSGNGYTYALRRESMQEAVASGAPFTASVVGAPTFSWLSPTNPALCATNWPSLPVFGTLSYVDGAYAARVGDATDLVPGCAAGLGADANGTTDDTTFGTQSYLWVRDDPGYTSCLDFLNQNPGTTGISEQQIDPDGFGGRPSFVATCDFDNGGWTLVARQDGQFSQNDFSFPDANWWKTGETFGTSPPVSTSLPLAFHLATMEQEEMRLVRVGTGEITRVLTGFHGWTVRDFLADEEISSAGTTTEVSGLATDFENRSLVFELDNFESQLMIHPTYTSGGAIYLFSVDDRSTNNGIAAQFDGGATMEIYPPGGYPSPCGVFSEYGTVTPSIGVRDFCMAESATAQWELWIR